MEFTFGIVCRFVPHVSSIFTFQFRLSEPDTTLQTKLSLAELCIRSLNLRVCAPNGARRWRASLTWRCMEGRKQAELGCFGSLLFEKRLVWAMAGGSEMPPSLNCTPCDVF